MLANLAERAETLDYRCPTLIDEDQIIIEAGRHPVVEQVMTDPLSPTRYGWSGAADVDNHRPQHGR